MIIYGRVMVPFYSSKEYLIQYNIDQDPGRHIDLGNLFTYDLEVTGSRKAYAYPDCVELYGSPNGPLTRKVVDDKVVFTDSKQNVVHKYPNNVCPLI